MGRRAYWQSYEGHKAASVAGVQSQAVLMVEGEKNPF